MAVLNLSIEKLCKVDEKLYKKSLKLDDLRKINDIWPLYGREKQRYV